MNTAPTTPAITQDSDAVVIESTALFDLFVDQVVKPWREQAASAERDGDDERREILDSCCDDVEFFIRSNSQDH
jgi:hypothetical protein